MSSSPLSAPTYAAYAITETSLGPRDQHYIFIETHEQGLVTAHIQLPVHPRRNYIQPLFLHKTRRRADVSAKREKTNTRAGAF
ncbi:hypothetical protein BDV11DRAFT_186410 [Aspergillus similis]